MSVSSRVVAAGAVLLAAAIPVGALTLSSSSHDDFSFGIATGSVEPRPVNPATSAADTVARPDPSSHLIPQNTAVDGDGFSATSRRLLAQTEPSAPPRSTGLIPQNPIADALQDPEPADAANDGESKAAAAEAPAAAEPERPARQKPRRTRQAKKKGPAAGSFEALFQGTGQ